MKAKDTEFVKVIRDDCRIRHHHSQIKSKVVYFMVQLELKTGNKWYPVIRYDTAHNFAHQDIYHIDGKSDKLPLGIADYNMAMTFAEEQLKSNWQVYIERFLKEVKNDG